MNGSDLEVAERIVLGACLIDRAAVPTLIEQIPAKEIFLNKANQAVYTAIIQLYENGHSIDTLTVSDQIKKNKQSELATPYHIVTLTSNVASAAHLETHCLVLKENYIRRELAELSRDTGSKSLDDSEDILDLVSDVQIQLNNLNSFTARKQEKRIDAILATLIKKTRDNTKIKLSFVTDELNAVSGELIILAARPGMGKTAFALQIAEYFAKDMPVGFLSLEMTDEQLVCRLVAKNTSIPFERIRDNEIRPEESEKHYKANQMLGELDLFIDDEAGITDLQAKSKISRMASKYGIGLVVVDYLQLMHSKKESREQEISTISRTLKTVAKDCNIPVIALSQLSRKCEERTDKKPLLSDLRESGAIEQDADQVWFLFRPEYYKLDEYMGEPCDGLCIIDVAKNRNGKAGMYKSRFIGSEFRFEKWDNFTKLDVPF